MTEGTGPEPQPSCLIVVPTLGDRVAYLEQTLASIRAQQEPVDIAVVTPRTAEAAGALALRFGATVLDDPGGLSAAVNVGMREARPWHRFGNWIGDDDLLEPGALGRAVAVLRARPDVSVVYGHCTYVDGDGRPLWVNRAGRWAPMMLGWGPNLVPQPGLVFRIADFGAVGGLDESLSYTMDLDLLLRLRRLGRLVDLDEPVSSFRWHADSLTVSARRASLDEAQQVKRRYLTRPARLLSPVWERPVRLATTAAANVMARRASRARLTRPPGDQRDPPVG